jgi:hypothetical protein
MSNSAAHLSFISAEIYRNWHQYRRLIPPSILLKTGPLMAPIKLDDLASLKVALMTRLDVRDIILSWTNDIETPSSMLAPNSEKLGYEECLPKPSAQKTKRRDAQNHCNLPFTCFAHDEWISPKVLEHTTVHIHYQYRLRFGRRVLAPTAWFLAR